MPGLSTMLDLDTLTVDVLVFFVWSVTPLSWLYVFITVLSRYTDWSIYWPKAHAAILTWCSIEAIFSIYYAYLIQLVQRRGPAPMYGRRFLRMVFSRALESGMTVDPDHAESLATTSEGGDSGSYGLRQRKQGRYDGVAAERPPPNPLATKRLRAASYLPRFVLQEPISRDDPRAKEFAEVCHVISKRLRLPRADLSHAYIDFSNKQCGSRGQKRKI